MLTSFRGRLAASIALASLGVVAPAMAQSDDTAEESGPITVSANVALTTDYRFRGVSLSGGDPAIQGGFDVVHESGFYAGTWASSIEGGPAYGEMEFDLYGGWSGDVTDGVTLDVGLLYYLYPTEELGADVDYLEPYASAAFALGPAQAEVGVAYAFEQDSLGGADNLYVYTDLGFALPDSPISLSAHLGYTDGALAPPLLAGAADDSGLDWSLGASVTSGILEVGVSYVGVEGPSVDGFTDDAIVGTISASF